MKRIINFFKKLRPKTKYILGVLALAAIVSQGVFAFTKLSATSPRFNFLSGDYELFRGEDKTAGETVWKDPASGNAGDIFTGIIYYHNGVEGTVAENTKIKVTIPATTVNKSATLSAQISADNAEAVTDTIVDGQVIGLSDLTANLNQDANIEFVSGSVKWYPDQQNNPDTPVVLPFGQSGDKIITPEGVNLGNINGCWQYAGFLTFDFRSRVTTAPAFTVDKTVKNITAGDPDYSDETNASANNRVEFKIVAINTGTEIAENVNIKDTLPAELSFVSGSMKIFRDGSGTAELLPDDVANQIFGTGWNMGDLQIGANKRDMLTFRAKAPSTISESKQVVNNAEITSGALSDSDNAKVNLVPTETPVIVPNKNAKNLTSGQVASPRVIGGRTVLAFDVLAGESIEYTLLTENTGSAAAENYQIQDGIADILEYADVMAISAGGNVVDGTTGNDARLVQYPAVTIGAGESVTRTFTVKVKDPIPNTPPNGYSYDMQMYNKYGDEVIVVLSRPTPPPTPPILHIEKLVRDFTVNELNFVDFNQAIAGDTLEYIIRFSNTGNGPADQVKFSDILPTNMQYISGTTIISVNEAMEHTLPDGIVAGGVTLDTIAAGDSGYIKFKVITDAGIASGTELTNTANLTDNGATISDTAKTTFKAPVIPVSVTPIPLPRTGADTVVIAAVAAFGLLALAYRVAKFI